MRRVALGERSVACSFLVVVAVMVALPWVATPLLPATARVACGVLFAAGALWLAGVGLQGRRPSVPARPAVAAIAVLGLGWLMALNAPSMLPTSSMLRRVAWLPSAAGREPAMDLMWQLSAVMLAAGIFCDVLARHRRGRFALVGAIAGSGAAVAFVGSLDRVGWWPRPYQDVAFGGHHFAAFSYHANAAAFLNVSLPAALLLVEWGRRQSSRAVLAGGVLCTATIVSGCLLHVSKAGAPVTALILIIGGLTMTSTTSRSMRRERLRQRWRAPAIALIGLGVVAAGAWTTASRWGEVPDTLGRNNGRLLMWETALHGWRDAPLFGVGPGSLKLLVPGLSATDVPELMGSWVVQRYAVGQPVGIYQYATGDPVQVLTEWGLVGAALWAALAMWPLLQAWRRRAVAGHRIELTLGALALLGVYLSSVIDFHLHVFSIELVVVAWAAFLHGR